MAFRSRLRPLLAPLFVTLLVPILAEAQGSADIGNDEIFAALGLHEGMTVCEIGAGDGALSIAAARIVGPHGRVYSSELGNSRVQSLKRHAEDSGLGQITVVAGDPVKTNFPERTCDALFMRNVYHHFDDPARMNASIAAALKGGGRLAVVDFTPPGREADSPQERDREGMHGVSADSVSRELKEEGFKPVSADAGRRWFMVVVSKPES